MMLLAVGPAEACRCRQQGVIEYFVAADVVAEARVAEVADVSLDGEMQVRRYRVDTLQVFKGRSVEIIHSYASSATCGVDFVPGQRLWLFADDGPAAPGASGTVLWMNSCNGTRPASEGFIDTEAEQVADTMAWLARRAVETARWFGRDELPGCKKRGQDETFCLPRKDSIAILLIEIWLEGER